MDREIAEQLYDPRSRKMPLRAQISFIKKQLKNKGIAPDVVDVEALVDPDLNYRENYANIMASLGGSGKVRAAEEGIMENPACSKVKELKQEISQHQKSDPKLQDLKAELKDAKTQCDCNSCAQMGLYDPAPRRRRGQRTLTSSSQKQRKLESYGKPPKHWFYAMLDGIKKRSDVRNPASIVRNIWRRLSPSKRAQIKQRELKDERFVYDLPLPEDHSTRGTGTVRVVKPFKLAEVQVNVPGAAYERIRKSGQFQTMKRNDGTIALVKRCKSRSGNCNIFVDKS